MKIALAIDRFHPRKGGAERSLARILTALRRRGHSVVVCAISGEASPEFDGEFQFVRTPRWPRWRRDAAFAERVNQRLAALAPDLVLGVRHVARADVILARGGLQCETVAANLRAHASPWRRLALRLSAKQQMLLSLERRLFAAPRPPSVVAPSFLVREHCMARFALPAERVSVVHTGVALDTFRPDERARKRAREEERLGEKVVALFAAHNFRLKGLPCLLESWRQLDATKYQLLVAGRDRPPSAARGLQNVRFLGDRPDMLKLFQAADFLAHPTFYDPFSRVAIEALACGLPVITTRHNGAAEIMKDEREGFLLDSPTELNRLTQCMKRLGDATTRREMGHAARRTAEEHPEEEFLDRTVQLIERAPRRRITAA